MGLMISKKPFALSLLIYYLDKRCGKALTNYIVEFVGSGVVQLNVMHLIVRRFSHLHFTDLGVFKVNVSSDTIMFSALAFTTECGYIIRCDLDNNNFLLFKDPFQLPWLNIHSESADANSSQFHNIIFRLISEDGLIHSPQKTTSVLSMVECCSQSVFQIQRTNDIGNKLVHVDPIRFARHRTIHFITN